MFCEETGFEEAARFPDVGSETPSTPMQRTSSYGIGWNENGSALCVSCLRPLSACPVKRSAASRFAIWPAEGGRRSSSRGCACWPSTGRRSVPSSSVYWRATASRPERRPRPFSVKRRTRSSCALLRRQLRLGQAARDRPLLLHHQPGADAAVEAVRHTACEWSARRSSTAACARRKVTTSMRRKPACGSTSRLRALARQCVAFLTYTEFVGGPRKVPGQAATVSPFPSEVVLSSQRIGGWETPSWYANPAVARVA